MGEGASRETGAYTGQTGKFEPRDYDDDEKTAASSILDHRHLQRCELASQSSLLVSWGSGKANGLWASTGEPAYQEPRVPKRPLSADMTLDGGTIPSVSPPRSEPNGLASRHDALPAVSPAGQGSDDAPKNNRRSGTDPSTPSSSGRPASPPLPRLIGFRAEGRRVADHLVVCVPGRAPRG